MRRIAIAVVVFTSLALTGCSAFVPSWNAQPTPIEIDNKTDSQDVNELSQEQTEPEPAEPQEDQQQPEPEPEPDPSEPVELETVNVEIVSAMVYESEGQIEVIAQVLDVVEDSGECSLKFLAGDFSTEQTVKAARSSNYTQCAAIDIPLSELPGGDAVVIVSYLSERYEGESNPASVVIP